MNVWCSHPASTASDLNVVVNAPLVISIAGRPCHALLRNLGVPTGTTVEGNVARFDQLVVIVALLEYSLAYVIASTHSAIPAVAGGDIVVVIGNAFENPRWLDGRRLVRSHFLAR
jgi:hypothetical protein